MTEKYEEIDYFCLFVGYARSGHSLVGALLDAHPDIVISHELHVLQCLKMNFPKEKIIEAICKKSQLFTRQGRTWFGYSYMISPQWHGKYRHLKVIGDKQGGKTNRMLRQFPQLLPQLRATMNMKHRYFHVVRNPFDIIATMHRRSKRDLNLLMQRFFQQCDHIIHLQKIISRDEWLDLHYEDLICNPVENIRKMIAFLGQTCDENYIGNCQKFLFPQPIQRRLQISWPPQIVDEIEAKISQYPFLMKYSFGN